MTTQQLITIREGLVETLQERLSAKLSYRLSRILKRVESELETFEESRKSLIEKHGEAQEDGSYRVPEERIDDFRPEYNDLLSTELDGLDLPSVSISDFEGVEIAGMTMVKIQDLITDPDE